MGPVQLCSAQTAKCDMRTVRRVQAHGTSEEKHLFGKWTLLFTKSSLEAPITHSSSGGHTHSGLHSQGFFLSGITRQTLLHTHPTFRVLMAPAILKLLLHRTSASGTHSAHLGLRTEPQLLQR